MWKIVKKLFRQYKLNTFLNKNISFLRAKLFYKEACNNFRPQRVISIETTKRYKICKSFHPTN